MKSEEKEELTEAVILAFDEVTGIYGGADKSTYVPMEYHDKLLEKLRQKFLLPEGAQRGLQTIDDFVGAIINAVQAESRAITATEIGFVVEKFVGHSVKEDALIAEELLPAKSDDEVNALRKDMSRFLKLSRIKSALCNRFNYWPDYGSLNKAETVNALTDVFCRPRYRRVRSFNV